MEGLAVRSIGKSAQRAFARVLPASMRARISVLAMLAVLSPAMAVITLCFALNAGSVVTLLATVAALIPATLFLYGVSAAAAPIRGFADTLADCAGDPAGQ